MVWSGDWQRGKRLLQGRTVGVPGGELTAERFELGLRLEELAVRHPGRLEEERGGASKVLGVDHTHYRPAARPGTQAEEPLDLQHAERFTK